MRPVWETRCGNAVICMNDENPYPDGTILADGTLAPAGTSTEDLWHPTCYRDRSEIKIKQLSPGQ